MSPYRSPAEMPPKPPAPKKRRRKVSLNLAVTCVLAFVYTVLLSWLRSHGLM